MKIYFCFISLFVALLFGGSSIQAQMISHDTTFYFGEYSFKTKYDTNEFSTNLKIAFNKAIIFNETFETEIWDIHEYVMNKKMEKVFFVDLYTGGAHCCSELIVGKIIDNKFKILDSIWWGNAGYEVQDIDNDGTLEVEGGKDMFAYAFTNYAETRFPPVIYRFENDRFVDATSRYPYIVKEDIKQLKVDLKEFTDSGIKCEGIDDDTFNTDAGSVKTILAAIVADYWAIGEVKKGYEIVNQTYKCPDKDKYIKILKDEFKLK